MDAVKGFTIVGIGVTTFLVVASVVTEAATTAIEFSAFLGIPAGLVGAGAVMVLAERLLGRSPSRATVAVATAYAATGYTVLALVALRYAVSATRAVLSTTVIGGTSLVVGVAVGGAVWVRREG